MSPEQMIQDVHELLKEIYNFEQIGARCKDYDACIRCHGAAIQLEKLLYKWGK